MQTVWLTIIVPAYNAEMFLRKCLDSVISLAIPNYEVIVIDDGSTDNTYSICEEYKNQYGFVTTIHQNNKGLRLTREVGINNARGKYICFVDADDWVEERFLVDALNIMEDNISIDITVSKSREEYPDGSFKEMFLNENDCEHDVVVLNREQAVLEMVSWKRYAWFLWGKVYRKELFNDCTWDETITTSEDLATNWEVFNKAKQVALVRELGYHYYYNGKGMTKGTSIIQNCASDLKVYCQILQDRRCAKNSPVRRRINTWCYKKYKEELLERVFNGEDNGDSRIDELVDSLVLTIDDGIEKNSWMVELIGKTPQQSVDIMKILFSNMKKRLELLDGHHGSLYIYGTGIIAGYVARMMDRIKIPYRGFIVSKGHPNIGVFCDKPVFSFPDRKLNPEVYIVVATANHASTSIGNMLDESGYCNVILLDIDNEFFV